MELKYLLDTNVIIALINGNKKLLQITDTADFVGISIISIIKFLSFSNLSEKDKILFHEFIHIAEVRDLTAKDTFLIKEVINVRKQYKLKLPDAVLSATPLVNNCVLITNDIDFKKVSSLATLTF